jgi:hypothetical protein
VKLLFACPSYGPLDPIAVRSQRAAIMHAAVHGGVTWVGDLSPDRVKFDASRNTVVAGVLAQAGEADAVFWCDSDVVLPVDAISRLVLEEKDFITGIYFQRYPPHFPLIAHFDEASHSFNWFVEWPENVVAPIDGCGFGCVLTSTALLRALEPPWFAFEKYSEDFDFCLKAARAGFHLHAHTGVLCGHLADPKPVTAADFTAQDLRGTRHGAVRSDPAA